MYHNRAIEQYREMNLACTCSETFNLSIKDTLDEENINNLQS